MNRVRLGEDTATCNVSPAATTAPSRGESILRRGSLLPSPLGGVCASIGSSLVFSVAPAATTTPLGGASNVSGVSVAGTQTNVRPGIGANGTSSRPNKRKGMGCFMPRDAMALLLA